MYKVTTARKNGNYYACLTSQVSTQKPNILHQTSCVLTELLTNITNLKLLTKLT